MTEASTLAGEKVLGSLRREITLSRIVLVAAQQHIKDKDMVDTSISAVHGLFKMPVSSTLAET